MAAWASVSVLRVLGVELMAQLGRRPAQGTHRLLTRRALAGGHAAPSTG